MKNYCKISLVALCLTLPAAVMADEDWTGLYAGVHLGQTRLTGPGVDDSDPMIGLHAGYDYDLGNWVIGGELSYDAAAEYSVGGAVSDVTTVRLKFKGGYDLGRTMVYGIVGLGTIDTGAFKHDGYTLGLGAAYRLSDHVTVGAEYLYDSFGPKGREFDSDTVLIKASYRF